MHRSDQVRAAYLGDSMPAGVGASESPGIEAAVRRGPGGGIAACSSSSGVTAGYGDTMVLRNVDFDGRRRPGGRPPRPQRGGEDHVAAYRYRIGAAPLRNGGGRWQGPDRPGRLPVHPRWRVPPARRAGHLPLPQRKDNLTIQARGRRLDEAIAESTELFPVLGTRLGQTAGSLSGGEQQMLALARAYLTDPRVVLVDEASLGLAPLVVDKIYEALQQLVAKGMSLVVVEQYVQKALELAQMVYILSKGQVILTGAATDITSDEIYDRYLGTAT